MSLVWSFFTAAGAVLIAVDAGHWGESLLLFAGVAVALLLLHQWNAGSFSARVAILGLALTAGVWAVGELVLDTDTSDSVAGIAARGAGPGGGSP